MTYMIYKILDLGFQFAYLALMVRVLISWIPHDHYHPLIQFLYRATDPMLRPFRNIIPMSTGIDLSPIFAFIALGIIKKILFSILF